LLRPLRFFLGISLVGFELVSYGVLGLLQGGTQPLDRMVDHLLVGYLVWQMKTRTHDMVCLTVFARKVHVLVMLLANPGVNLGATGMRRNRHAQVGCGFQLPVDSIPATKRAFL